MLAHYIPPVSTKQDRTRDESYWPALDGSAAYVIRTNTLDQRNPPEKPRASVEDSRRWHPGYGAHAEQAAWRHPASV